MQKAARFCKAAFHWIGFRGEAYSPLPKRLDHQPALRGSFSLADSVSGSAEADAPLGGSIGCCSAGGVVTGWASRRKLTFSRTVERRCPAALSASWAVSSAEAERAASCWL